MKLAFLKSVWPQEHIHHLGPRAALLVEGAAFTKVSRMTPERLKSEQGVEYLVEALGGQWGRLKDEDRLELFEKALYLTQQKSDETNDSYLNRHDNAFEELISRKVSLEEVRAYVMLRQSLLGPEDRKRVIVESKGKLDYETARSSIRLLGAKFFQDLSGTQRAPKKTYDVHQVEETPDEVYVSGHVGGSASQDDEDAVFNALYEAGDEDAIFVAEFEDQILETLQNSETLAPVFVSYQEARFKLREKAKSRGFWPIASKGKGKKGEKKGKNSPPWTGNSFNRRKSLEFRIANSTCRRCGQPGHWKRDCPLGADDPKVKQAGAEMITMTEVFETEQPVKDFYDEIPPEATPWMPEAMNQLDTHVGSVAITSAEVYLGVTVEEPQVTQKVRSAERSDTQNLIGMTKFQTELCLKLHELCRKHDRPVAEVRAADVASSEPTPEVMLQSPGELSMETASVFQVEELSHEAIIDTGASRTVIGENRVEGLLNSLLETQHAKAYQAKSDVHFRFGNNGVLQSKYALFLPREKGGFMRVEVVPGNTPFLVSNSVLRSIGAVLDISKGMMWIHHGTRGIPLRTCRKQLMCVDIGDILRSGGNAEVLIAHGSEFPTPEETTPSANRSNLSFVGSDDFQHKMSANAWMHEGKSEPVVSLISGEATEDSAAVSTNVSERHKPVCCLSHDATRSHELLGGPLDRTHRPHLGGQSGGGAGFLPTTSRGRDSDAVGTECLSGGQAQGKDLLGGDDGQSDLPQPPQESQGAGIMLSQLHQLRQGISADGAAVQEQHTNQRSNSEQPLRGDESWDCGTRPEFQGTTGKQDNAPVNLSQAGECQRVKADHARGDGCGEGAVPDYADCHSATRTGQVHSGPGGRISRRRGALDAEDDRVVKFIEGPSEPAYEKMSEQQVNQAFEKLDMLSVAIEENLHQMSSQASSLPRNRRFPKRSDVGIDLLEVYCSPLSQLTHQMKLLGGQAIRFSMCDGDLSTVEGQRKLWTWIHMYEPRHVWLAPECRLYSSFASLNRSRSLEAFDRWNDQLEHNRTHLQLCNHIYLHQVAEGRHTHLEQPARSQMLQQPEMEDLLQGTLPATFDMCQVGKLHIPRHAMYLRKSTTVFTTSRHLHCTLHDRRCDQSHFHTPIEGQVKMNDNTPMSTSRFAAQYTPQFARTVARAILDECFRQPEFPLFLSELLVATHDRPDLATEALQLQKRRRYTSKQPPRPADRSSSDSSAPPAPSWDTVLSDVGPLAPRVGNFAIRPGDAGFLDIQQLVPELELRLILLCRGTERFRVPGEASRGDDMPWRKTVIVRRSDGKVQDLGPPEHWKQLPRLQRLRKAGAARLSLTAFGIQRAGLGNGCSPPATGNSARASQVRIVDEGHEPEVPHGDGVDMIPPSILQSGPAFQSLSSAQQTALKRLHNNLGHPDVDRMVKFLEHRGADSALVDAAKDMHCGACTATSARPKLPHPSALHDDLDFNDVVGADGAYWTSSQGRTYHFMHFIDESTLFHVGAAGGRTVADQVELFENVWLNWAGPCKKLYLDPAGEYVNPAWQERLQKEGITVVVAAGESHWQIGRSEAHGRMIKGMLDRMNAEQAIESDEEFRICLRHAFNAKNALSRIRGFSPEQALLGKARALPASLTGDDTAASHSLADSELPEGLKFRADLQRREQARRAFVSADNDSAARRALLRRSCPGQFTFSPGDWVLYWRQQRGNSRTDRGRWYGPGQVFQVEGTRVIWISHGGYLIRASPEQIRPASLREYGALPRNAEGRVIPEEVRHGRNFISLDAASGGEEMPTNREASPEVMVVPRSRTETDVSQPEGEISPPEGMSREASSAGYVPSVGIPDGVDVPVSDGDIEMDDTTSEDLLFGDDVEPCVPLIGVWEIALVDQMTFASKQVCDETEVAMFSEWILTASEARKQKSEVQWRHLSPDDQKLFEAAKAKEIKAWVDHQTVRRVAPGTLRDEQIMRCRWILTWKPPVPGSPEYRAKARLVILGFEDPSLSSLPSDAPTLSKDAKQLICQQVASRGWTLINFDIATAFLRGEGDGRMLGIHAPAELASAIGMKDQDQCKLVGGAYGRVDAPILWYRTLRRTLEELGFLTSPLDGCLFTLATRGSNGKPRVRGVLGMHVDDGIGGGDEYFGEVIGRLRSRFSFGAYNERDFEFCGVRYYQWDDGSIEMSQEQYVQKIESVNVPRARRVDPQSMLTPAEQQSLRQICGSLQYAAVQTRPDLAAKVGEIQAMIGKAQIEHLLEANRILYEAKTHRVTLMMVPIREDCVTFCAFSDASFETSKGRPSRQGTIIFTTDGGMVENQLTVICPIAWSSKRIPQVVRSTLSAEAIALGSTLDRLGWLRIMWKWMCDPSVDWSDPGNALKTCPMSTVATDCKSVYDLSTKTSTPNCSEPRCTLECLLIRERLQENVKLRWVTSRAQLADCLTKSMDGAALRKALEVGRYSLFDEDKVLQQRAGHRERLKWISREQTASEESQGHAS